MKLQFLLAILLLFKNYNSENLSDAQIVNTQLSALKQSLVSLNLSQFQKLFDHSKVTVDTVFQPGFSYPNNVFALMGDNEFKNSLQIFSAFQPTRTLNGDLRALVSIEYKLDGHIHKMEKEITISKSEKSATGHVFSGFEAV